MSTELRYIQLKGSEHLHWFETRWWIYQCINPSFSPLDRFCLLCWIVSKPVYACFLLPWSRWWFDTCFFFQFDEYFQNGWKQETNWDTGILSWGNQPPNTGISICKDEGKPVITWSILSPYHHPSQFPLFGRRKTPKALCPVKDLSCVWPGLWPWSMRPPQFETVIFFHGKDTTLC